MPTVYISDDAYVDLQSNQVRLKKELGVELTLSQTITRLADMAGGKMTQIGTVASTPVFACSPTQWHGQYAGPMEFCNHALYLFELMRKQCVRELSLKFEKFDAGLVGLDRAVVQVVAESLEGTFPEEDRCPRCGGQISAIYHSGDTEDAPSEYTCNRCGHTARIVESD